MIGYDGTYPPARLFFLVVTNKCVFRNKKCEKLLHYTKKVVQ